ncbi:MAG: transposase family protein [Burkholderiales bacterium]|nr:transposase family protein [Burkholderiales bacterium]
MLSDIELDRLFAQWNTPEAGRRLIREIRAIGPVRKLQGRMDTVRTRFISKKMARALYAESRTVELPAIQLHEHDKSTIELWPQPCTFDLMVQSMKSGRTRVQHTPDLFLITETGFVIKELREEARLLGYAAERPHHFYKDEQGRWHYLPAEEHCAKLGIEYRLVSADEHPRIFLANLAFLEDYNLETTLAAPPDEANRLVKLLDDRGYIPHLELVHQHGFKADHIFQFVLNETVYVDLHTTRLDLVDDLLIYRDKVVARATELFNEPALKNLPESALVLRSGTRFLYEKRPFEVVMVGTTEVIVRDEAGASLHLPLQLVEDLFKRQMLISTDQTAIQKEYDLDTVVTNKKQLEIALQRRDALQGTQSHYSKRTFQRWRQQAAGLPQPQDQLLALMPDVGSNRSSRLPDLITKLAEKVVKEHHNVVTKPSIQATYLHFVNRCDEAGLTPMSRSSFYEWIKRKEDIKKREGRRMAYQKAAIPLIHDYDQPVHGVLPHQVVYIDHTVVNILLKGRHIENLGKPILTIAVDGALSMARAFYLSYHPAGLEATFMVLRDYVRRHGCLPRTLVLDNGKEFHSESLKLFCSLFGIDIRWRRRSMPRDSTLVERLLGVVESEVISSLEGNSIALKDPRMLSSSHNPNKHIKWTLPALHGAIDHFLFEVHAKRIHPRFGVTPLDHEKRLILEHGAREHRMVRYDKIFRLLTSTQPGTPTREIDRRRGVFVDGRYYWNPKLALTKSREKAEVRVEMWNAQVVYVCFRDEWLVAQARDGGPLNGRFRYEVQIQKREESRAKINAAQRAKSSPAVANKKTALWKPEIWDDRLREQSVEAYYLYERLGMVEALPEAKNPSGLEITPLSKPISVLNALQSIAAEPDETERETRGAESKGTRIRPKKHGPAESEPANEASPPSDEQESVEAPLDADYF